MKQVKENYDCKSTCGRTVATGIAKLNGALEWMNIAAEHVRPWIVVRELEVLDEELVDHEDEYEVHEARS